MILLPIYRSESAVSDGRWLIETLPVWTPILSQLTSGEVFQVKGTSFSIVQVGQLPDGALEFLVDVKGAGSKGGVVFGDLIGGALSGIAAQLAGQIIRRVAKVLTPRQEFGLYLAAIAAALGLVWVGWRLWNRRK